MLRTWACVAFVFALNSCASERLVEPVSHTDGHEHPYHDHIVMFDAAGRPIDPQFQPWSALLPYRVMEDDEFQLHIDDVFEGVATTFKADGVKDLFVFVHGGMNTQEGSVDRARELLPLMLDDGYYPIFINWQSSLVSSYFEHLFFVRQGKDEGWGGAIWAPFILLSDMAKTIARAPIGVGRMASTMWSSLPFTWTEEKSVARSTANAADSEFRKAKEKIPLTKPPGADPTPKIAIGTDLRLGTFPIEVEDDERGTGEQAWSMTKWVVTSPIKIVTGVLVQGFGTPAWEMMLRRTHLLFAEEDRYLDGGLGTRDARRLDDDRGAGATATEGAHAGESDSTVYVTRDPARLAWFFDEAARKRESWKKLVTEGSAGNGGSVRTPNIIACGHSMGAIVLNELVRRDTRRLLRHVEAPKSKKVEPKQDPQQSAPSKPVPRDESKESTVTPLFDDLIYMAPACSVADFVDTVIPYLELSKSTRVHVLVLHPNAEINESNAFEFAPRGSLLDWIDTLLSTPTDSRELRLGSFTNLMLSLHEFPASVRGRIQIHAFGYARPERAREPERHDAFADLSTARWWRRSFWEVWPRRIATEDDRRNVEQAVEAAKAEVEQKSRN